MADGHLRELADLAANQWGLFTTAQSARLFDMPFLALKRHVDDGTLVRIRHGVYRFSDAAGHTGGSPMDEIRAEWLAIEPRRTLTERIYDTAPMAVVSHRTAAWVQGLGSIRADDQHHYTMHHRRRRRGVVFHVADFGAADWHLVDDLPVTLPLRTVADLACAGTATAQLVAAADTALHRGDAYADELATAMRPHDHHLCRRNGDAVRRFTSSRHRRLFPSSEPIGS